MLLIAYCITSYKILSLGLIHANHGNEEVVNYLREQLGRGSTSAVRHGACLGLGLAAMGTFDEKAMIFSTWSQRETTDFSELDSFEN